jgi:uncharacterized membrane protein YfcA
MFLGMIVTVAFISAILNGLTSVGGAVLFVFALIFMSSLKGIFSTLSMEHIVTLAVFFSLACAVTGTLFYYKKKLYDKNMNIYLGIGTLLGGYGGSLLASTLSNEFMQLLFFVLALVASGSVLFNEKRFSLKSRLSYYWLILIGIVLGVIGGIFGLGLGFLVLPVMVVLYKVAIKDAIGSSLFCAAMLTTGALLGKIGTPYFDLVLVIVIMLAGATGTLAGGMISVKIQSKSLQTIVAIILVGVSLKFLFDWII